MFRNILWCYVFILTLLDLALKTKLTAQGESHGVSHDSFIEGITFQEWEQEAGAADAVDAADGAEGVWVWPRELRFGRVALGVAHARSVTVTNRANATLHLASVAGTTPDFHASFFDSKTLAPAGSTTFSVVYLGRREGPAAAHLYLHTSLGVHKYPVSAVGEASPFGVWPLVGLRVPLDARVEPELTLYNPTDATVQVHEVYSTGAWLTLQLPAGEASAPRAAWAVPPRETRTLVRLRVAPPPRAPQPLTAYVRVKADVPGGGLLLAVEARAVPAGEHARPLHVRLRARGAADPAHTVELELANSGGAEVALEAVVSGAGCWRGAPPAPCAAPPAARANGGAAPGAHLSLLRAQLAPHQDFVRVALLTLDFAELWAQAPGAGGEAWCAGCVRLGGAHVPYSVRLLPGALRFTPPHLDVLTAGADAAREHELRAHNYFARALRLLAVTLPGDVADHFQMESLAPLTLAPGASATVVRLRLRERALPPDVSLHAALLVHTELAQYRVPLRLYSGRILFEWEWPNATESLLELGTLGTSATRRVGVRLRNPAPVPLCIAALSAELPGAAASFARAHPAPECLDAGAAQQAWLTVVAPAREGALRGELRLRTRAPHAAVSAVRLALRVRTGHVRLLPLRMPPAAPYADSWAELQADNSMAVRMRVTRVALPPRRDDPALSFQWEGDWYGEVRPGRSRVALARHSPQRRCEPACYSGLPLAGEEGAAWLRRGAALDGPALRADLQLLRARLALFDRQRAALDANFTLHMHTSEALRVEAAGAAPLAWPRFLTAGIGAAPLAPVGRAAELRLQLRSEAHVPVLLQALLAAEPEHVLPDLPDRAGGALQCAGRCRSAGGAFRLTGWSAVRGAASPWNESRSANDSSVATPLLLLAPHTELELSVVFAPQDAGSFGSYLYLRNNLTILEGVQLYGEGEYPSFDLSGRRPGSEAPILIEVKECVWGAEPALARHVTARNTGRVGVTLADWAVAGEECAGRGFALRPCAPLRLAPNGSLPLQVHFVPDYTLARVAAPLAVRTERGVAEFLLLATVPAAVLAQCAAGAPRPPWDATMRTMGVGCAITMLACVLVFAMIDAEGVLRRARATRAAAAPPRPPLDLRSLPEPAPAAPPPARAPARRRRAARRALPALDAHSERRAFERWRAEVLRRADDSSRSSDDDTAAPPPSSPEPAAHPADDVLSSASDESAPADERDDEPYGADVERDDEPYGADVEPDAPDDEPRAPAAPSAARALVATPPPGARARVAPRRAERARADPERRAAPGRAPARKERAGKRRAERPPPTPPPRSPAPAAPAVEREAGEARAPRPWASWSAVVAARGAPALAPIGSDVRRRSPSPAPDNSLFYFNGTAADAARDSLAWRAPRPAPAWGSWGAWPAAPVRPPPGFAPPAPAPAPDPPLEPRAYDPFRSLASIWAPAPSDWRAADDQRDRLD